MAKDAHVESSRVLGVDNTTTTMLQGRVRGKSHLESVGLSIYNMFVGRERRERERERNKGERGGREREGEGNFLPKSNDKKSTTCKHKGHPTLLLTYSLQTVSGGCPAQRHPKPGQYLAIPSAL